MVLEDVCELIADCPHTTAPDEGKGYAGCIGRLFGLL